MRDEGARDRDALALAARELGRESLGERGRQSDALEQLGDLGLGLSATESPQNAGRPSDRIAYAMPRVQRLVGVLEDDLDAPARLGRAVLGACGQRFASEDEAPRRRRVQANDAARDGRLARAGLADKGHTLPPRELEAHVVDRHRSRRPASVLSPQRFDREHSLGLLCGSSLERLLERQRRRLPPLEAAHPVVGCNFLARRHSRLASVHPLWAPRRKRTTGSPFANTDGDARDPLHPAGRGMVGDRRDQPARVGVGWPCEHLGGRALLHEAARVHDGEPVGDRGHDGQVVAHVENGEAVVAPQPVDLLEDASLGHDVEPGSGLVHHDGRRLAHERRGDRDPLLLSTRELVRKSARERAIVGEVDALEGLTRAARRVRAGNVRAKHLPDGIAHPVRRVERRRRVLRNVGDDPAAERADRALVSSVDQLAVDLDGPRRDSTAAASVAQERQSGRRLPAPRLAHETQDFARRDLERDVLDDRLAGVELDAQGVDANDALGHRAIVRLSR